MKKLAVPILFACSSVFAAEAVKPTFTNVTVRDIDVAPRVEFNFWNGFVDLNNDGCLDIFVGTHKETGISAMYLQETIANTCPNKLKHYPNNDNYSQVLTRDPRITSRYMFANLYGNADGLPAFLGQDSDLGRSAKYVVAALVDNKPVYERKSTGCFDGACVPFDADGDGNFELYRGRKLARSGTVISAIASPQIRSISGEILEDLIHPTDLIPGNIVGIFDADNDSWPDIVNASEGGYWSYDPVENKHNWVGGKISIGSLSQVAGSGHLVPLDYDGDGWMDFFAGQGHYDKISSANRYASPYGPEVFYPHLYRNNGDGSFTEVTEEAGLAAMSLGCGAYYCTYGASSAADVNIDGHMDIVLHALTPSTIAFLLNNGDGTFTLDKRSNFGSTPGRPWGSMGDYNNDGLPDYMKLHGNSGCSSSNTTCPHQSAALFENTTETDNHWLRVRVQGKTTDGFHSSVTVRDSTTGNIIQHQEIGMLTNAYSNLVPHFGLGSATSVDVTVRFPHDGPTYTLEDVEVDQDIIVRLNGDIVAPYIPGTNPLHVPANGSEPPDEEPECEVEPCEEPPVEEPPVDPYANLKAQIALILSELNSIKTEIEGVQARHQELRSMLQTLEGLLPEPPVEPEPLGIVPMGDNPLDNLLMGFSETARRNWNFGGHNVPDPFSVDLGYWEEDKQFEPWLFDRASGFFQLYQLTSNPRDYDVAVHYLQEYAEHIGPDGHFNLKTGEKDTKYLYLKPFYLFKTITPPDGSAPDITPYLPVIERIYTASKAGYDPSKVIANIKPPQVWTEREAGLHGEAALYKYKLTGDLTALDRAKAVITQWGPRVNLVPYGVHEAESSMYPVSSPWMAALYFQFARDMLGNGLDDLIYEQVSLYARFMMEPYTYTAYDGKVYPGWNGFVMGETYSPRTWAGVLSPRCLTGPWHSETIPGKASNCAPTETDTQHAVDILGMFHFAKLAMIERGEDTSTLNGFMSKLEVSAVRGLQYWKRTTTTLPMYRANPPRIWNWLIRGRHEFVPTIEKTN